MIKITWNTFLIFFARFRCNRSNRSIHEFDNFIVINSNNLNHQFLNERLMFRFQAQAMCLLIFLNINQMIIIKVLIWNACVAYV